MQLYKDMQKRLNEFEMRFGSTEGGLTLSHHNPVLYVDPETGGANFSSSKEGTGSAP